MVAVHCRNHPWSDINLDSATAFIIRRIHCIIKHNFFWCLFLVVQNNGWEYRIHSREQHIDNLTPYADIKS